MYKFRFKCTNIKLARYIGEISECKVILKEFFTYLLVTNRNTKEKVY